MATIIAVTNQKGGVGKTTTSCALAAGLRLQNKTVLGIDLDPQGNFGFSLGVDIDNCPTVLDVLKGRQSIEAAIQHTEYCDILTSDILLSSCEMEFTGSGRESLLKQALKPVMNRYNYIIIDTPPALNILTVNAYTAANFLIIPMGSEILSLVGLSQLKDTVESVRQSFNPELHVLGILLTKYNRRTLLSREVKEMAEQLAAQIGTVVFNTQIRPGVAVAEAPAHGESIFEYAPRANPVKDYQEFLEEIADNIGL